MDYTIALAMLWFLWEEDDREWLAWAIAGLVIFKIVNR